MRRKVLLSIMVLTVLTALFSLIGVFVRNAICKLAAPEVDVIPPEISIGQQVLVKAKISVISC
jgi:hypothetical protein